MPRAQPRVRPSTVAPRSTPRTVTRSRAVEPMEQQIGQDRERILKNDGPASEALEPAFIQVVDRPVDKEKLEMLKFMEDPVKVHIHASSNQSDEQVFEIFNNGQREVFRRGETKVVARKFVNELAMRKITTFSQEFRPDQYGTPIQVQIPHTSLRYPFSVIEDPHPRGADWLKFTLAQP